MCCPSCSLTWWAGETDNQIIMKKELKERYQYAPISREQLTQYNRDSVRALAYLRHYRRNRALKVSIAVISMYLCLGFTYLPTLLYV